MIIEINRKLTLTTVTFNNLENHAYGLTTQGELYAKDTRTQAWSKVPVLVGSGSTKPTLVQFEGRRVSLSNILSETFTIANAEAVAIVNARYSSGNFPTSYREFTGVTND